MDRHTVQQTHPSVLFNIEYIFHDIKNEVKNYGPFENEKDLFYAIHAAIKKKLNSNELIKKHFGRTIRDFHSL